MPDPHQGRPPAPLAPRGPGARGRLSVGDPGPRILVVLLTLFAALAAAQPSGAIEIRWRSPVDAPIVDGFRPPEERWGAGNRGLEYGLEEETEIRAVDAGRVRFAGRVAGSLFVTIDHGDGLWSTSAYLTSIAVVRGQTIGAGQTLGTAGPGFHLTARLDGEYVDPSIFLDGARVGVRLVAGPEPPSRPGASAPNRPPGRGGGMLPR